MYVQKIAAQALLFAVLMSSTISHAMDMQLSNPFSSLNMNKRDAMMLTCGAGICGLGIGLGLLAKSHFGKKNSSLSNNFKAETPDNVAALSRQVDTDSQVLEKEFYKTYPAAKSAFHGKKVAYQSEDGEFATLISALTNNIIETLREYGKANEKDVLDAAGAKKQDVLCATKIQAPLVQPVAPAQSAIAADAIMVGKTGPLYKYFNDGTDVWRRMKIEQAITDQAALHHEFSATYCDKGEGFYTERVEYQYPGAEQHKIFISPHINDLIKAFSAYTEANENGCLDAAGAKNNLFDQGLMYSLQQTVPDQFWGDFVIHGEDDSQHPDFNVICQSLINERVIAEEYARLFDSSNNGAERFSKFEKHTFTDVNGNEKTVDIQKWAKDLLLLLERHKKALLITDKIEYEKKKQQIV